MTPAMSSSVDVAGGSWSAVSHAPEIMLASGRFDDDVQCRRWAAHRQGSDVPLERSEFDVRPVAAVGTDALPPGSGGRGSHLQATRGPGGTPALQLEQGLFSDEGPPRPAGRPAPGA